MTMYVLNAPLSIGPRLMPSAEVDPGAQTGGRLSAEIIGFEPSGRARLRYFIDFPGGTYEGSDITMSPMYADREPGDIVRGGIATLCAFLSAEAEAYAGSGNMGANEPADGWMFSAEVAEWAYLNSDELSMLGLELDEQA
jgi:hypothetical protein